MSSNGHKQKHFLWKSGLAGAWLAAGALGAATAQPAPSAPAPSSPPPQTQPSPSLNTAQQIAQLHWVAGPATLHIAGNSTFNIPAGYEMLSPPDSVSFLQLNQNPTSAQDNGDYILQSTDPNVGWFSALFYEDVGHIADNQTIDAGQLLTQARQNADNDNAERQKLGMPSLQLQGWAIQPGYDAQTHRLQWAFTFKNPNGSQVVNLNTRILSRTGDLKLIFVDDPASLTTDLPGFNAALGGFSFDPGQRYADYKTGDKLAEFGIAGLIAGGAAAVAVKTGFFAGLLAILAASGKAVIIGIVAAFAAVRAFFRKMFRRTKA